MYLCVFFLWMYAALKKITHLFGDDCSYNTKQPPASPQKTVDNQLSMINLL